METIFLYELTDIKFEDLEEGKIIKGDISPEKINHPDLTFTDTLKFEVVVEVKPKKIFVKGKVEGEIKLTCDKCLEDYNFAVNDNFEYVFFLTKIVVDKKYKEFKLTKDDLEIDFIENDTLPLRDIILGEFFLNIPIKKLCSKNCKGLCPVCGCNLNKESCSCERELKSSPFAKLKELLK